MGHAIRRSSLLLGIALILTFSPTASALITGGFGNDPVRDAGWPLGAVDVANLKTRVGWWEGPPFGGGQYQYLYRGKTDDFVAALKAFAAIKAPARELVVLDGPHEAFWLKIDRGEKDKANKTDPRVDWTFTVWVPSSWHRLYNNPKSVFAADQPNFRRPVDPPRIELYVGGGQVEWDKVKVPQGITVIDKRASAAGVKAAGGGAIIRGNVYDMATGKPVSRAQFTVEKQAGQGQWDTIATAEADASGAFELKNVPPGERYRYAVSGDGYAPRVIGYDAVTDGAYRPFPDVQLGREAKLSGTCTDDSGKPVKGVKVRPTPIAIDGRGYTVPATAEVTTGDDGRFELTGLPEGYAELWCHAPGYFQPDSVAKLHDVPAKGLVIRMVGTGKVKVTVVGPDGKPPTGNVHVHVNPEGEQIGKWGGSAELKPDGTYEFDGVPPGKYWVSTIPSPGMRAEENPAAKPIVIEAGKTAQIKLVHRPSGGARRDAVN